MSRLKQTLLLLFIYPVVAATQNAKYLSDIHPITLDHQYIHRHKAATFWRVSPFYIAQRNGSSCSLASVTMLVNAARNLNPTLANQKLLTQEDVLASVNIKDWEKGVAPNGDGISLDQLSTYLPIALDKNEVHQFSLKTVHVNDQSKETFRHLEETLLDMEAGKSFILVNFDLRFISEIEHGGHISPIGAYDAAHKKVLIMDVYRYTFEPYWVPLETLVESMATKDSASPKNRGYLIVSLT